MLKSRKKRLDKLLKGLNVILFSIIVIFALIIILMYTEKESTVELSNAKSLLKSSKVETMLSNERVESDIISIEKKYIETEDELMSVIDPDLDYAIKLFESSVNKKISKTFKKPFNYKEDSYCKAKFVLAKESFKFIECNGDAIYKRELQLAIEKIMPIERFTYNKINLGKKEIIVLLRINK